MKRTPEELAREINIAELLDEQELTRIGHACKEGYELDEKSRKDWMDKYDQWMLLAMQVEEKKTFPWEGAANVKYPLITIASMQFSARAYPALIPGTNVVHGHVNGFDPDGQKQNAAIRVSKHMSYQLLEQMDGWEEGMDRLCSIIPIIGCMFKKTYYSPLKQKNISEIVYPKDLVINYWTKSLDDSPRTTEIIRLDDNAMYERKATGLFLDVDISKEEQGDELHKLSDISNMDKVEDNDTQPYILLEQHTYLDLDDDGYKEPYVVTLDKASGTILRIAPRFDEESVVRNEQGDLLRIVPDSYYTKFGFVPNPDGGFYDVGFGLLLSPLNKSINTLLNQLIDAGTLSNLQAGFMSRGIRIQGGNSAFKPGEWKTAHFTGDDLRKGIVPLPVREPSGVLFNLLQLLLDGGQRVSTVTDMTMGENPGQNQPATTTMAVLEQGQKVFNSIYKRLHRSLKTEFKKLHKLNAKYLEPIQYFTVLDLGEEFKAPVRQTDYNIDVTDVTPASDPNMSSTAQKLIKAQQLMELLQLGTVNPIEVTKRILEASEQPGIETLMQMPPPQPNPEVQFEQAKFQDESARDWERIEIEKFEAGMKQEIQESKNRQAAEAQQLEREKAQVDAMKTGHDMAQGERPTNGQ